MAEKKRYMLFAGRNYHPSGGLNDFVDFFSSLGLAKEYLSSESCHWGKDWAHILDLHSLRIVSKLTDVSGTKRLKFILVDFP